MYICCANGWDPLEPQDHLPKERVSEILLDLAERYCASRCPDQMAWGRIHTDTPNPHIHLRVPITNSLCEF